MSKILLALAGCTLAALPLCAQQTDTLTVKVDPSKTHGTWEGWGTSLAWWAKIFGDRDDLADVLFTAKAVTIDGKTLPGLGMTIARYNAGACSGNEIDGRRMVVSKIIQPFRQIEGYWLDGKSADPKSKSWNWNVDANQRAMLLKARDRGAKHFELFSNSPMWWMCANDNPSGAAKGTDDNLPTKNYAAFATYLATIAKYAKENWGIAFTTVDPFNEPISGYWSANCKQEGCQFNPPAQAAFLPLFRAELDRQGLRDLPISASDESKYDQAIKTWKSFRPEIRALVARINVHGYQGGGGNRGELYRLATAEKKPIWQSEHGDKFGDGLEMARNFHRDMSALHPLAWCYWQVVDGGNNGGWGFFGGDLIKGKLGAVNPKFFVFAQYSRHIRPGMTILESGAANTVAAYDAAARKLVLATFNDGPERTITYDLSAFNAPNGPVPSARTEPSASVLYQKQPDIRLSGGRFAVNFPRQSIQTFEISNVTPR